VQYLPISIVLAWIYERSGTIWTSIFFHMGINAMSFYVLNALEQL
jgi:membrane protease YdiL (CAAX protease family)